MSSRTRIAVVLVVAGAAIAGVGLVSRRRPVNVLLITVDTLRADHCSLYGYGRPTTPELERLAARGTTYEQADAAAAFTQGSVGTILTGLWPRQHGAASHPSVLDSASETLAEALKARGYETRAVVTNRSCERAGFDQGFDHYDGADAARTRRRPVMRS
ncbi:MAG: sulfatase-like hydrolase/transferase [Acidobacteriota bacterium]